MYVGMYVCMYECMYAIYSFIYLFNVCIYVCMSVCLCVCSLLVSPQSVGAFRSFVVWNVRLPDLQNKILKKVRERYNTTVQNSYSYNLLNEPTDVQTLPTTITTREVLISAVAKCSNSF